LQLSSDADSALLAPEWGYDRIQCALKNLGHTISDASVGTILKAHGLEPAPERNRQSTWKVFLRSHWEVLAAIDFTTVEVWSKKGLVTFYLLFVMEVATRRVCFAGCTPNPEEAWMKQVARNLTDAEDGFLEGKRYVLMDRDSKFSVACRQVLQDAGTEPVLLPPRSPNLNAHLERFHLSLKSECLDRLIFFGEKGLRRAVHSYISHSRGAQSLGFEQSTDRGRPGSGARDGQRSLPGTTRRDATLLLPRGGLKERPIMFGWIRTRLQGWAHRVQQKGIERLIEENRRLKAQLLESNGGKPIRLTPEQRHRLEVVRKGIDPEVLKHIDLLADAE
jgi:transposase InsO family protein